MRTREAALDSAMTVGRKKKKLAVVCYNCGGKGHPLPDIFRPRHPSCRQKKETPTRCRRRVIYAGSSGNVDSTVQATKTMTSLE